MPLVTPALGALDVPAGTEPDAPFRIANLLWQSQTVWFRPELRSPVR